ncbi:35469_t:CDS:1, partial [Gigaspora margarita]
GELYKGNNMIQILTSEIEWNYAQQSGRNTISLLENVSSKKRNQHLMNYENRYQNKKPNLQQTKVTIDENEDHREEKDLSKESGDKTQNEAEENINSKTNLLKSAIKKTMKK